MPSPSKILRDLAKKTNTASAARKVLRAVNLQSGPPRLPDPRAGIPAALLPAAGSRIAAENAEPGSSAWRMGSGRSRPATDRQRQIKGYASTDSVPLGGSIDFHVAVEPAGSFTVAVYRLGHYGGKTGRHLTTSPTLTAGPQPVPTPDPETGRIAVDWPVAWTLDVGADWTSGAYVAVLDKHDGHRNFVPFVVRDDGPTRSDFLVVLPTTSWQAYNWWPRDGITGRNVYYGYVTKEAAEADPALKAKYSPDAEGWISNPSRAREVSFARPYFGDGLPDGFSREQSFILWAEAMGYDLSYATGLDLHEGRIDQRHRALIFAGHDEYWSTPMYRHAEEAVAAGTSLVFLTANNAYWHVRYDTSTRTMACYKGFEDPHVDDFATGMWRAGDGHPRAEQQLMGVQYSGIVKGHQPLVVREADHWFWAGTGLKDGDQLPKLLGGEADSLFPDMPRAKSEEQALLTASPYTLSNGTPLVQNTSLYRAPSGAWVFTAGTFHWPFALGHHAFLDKRVHRATANLLAKLQG